jgi:hypothetical protein
MSPRHHPHAIRTALARMNNDEARAVALLIENVVDGCNPDELAEWLDGRTDLADALFAFRQEHIGEVPS